MADCYAIFVILVSLTVAVWGANVPASTCESLKSPINGLVQCSINGTVLTCTGICNNGYVFSTGGDFITRTCEAGVWNGGSELPLCINDLCRGRLLSSVNNSDITASSVWAGVRGYYFGAERARFDSDVVMVDNVVQSGGWRPASNTLDQYIQVKLPDVKRITGIITKGRAVLTGDTANDYVAQYRVLYSMDGKTWTPYSSQTVGDAFLSGNIDNNTPKTNILSCPFDARYVRINPIAWHDHIAMRIEILGCNPDGSKPTCSSPTAPTTMNMMKTTTMQAPIISQTSAPDLCTSIPPPVNGMIGCEVQIHSSKQLVCVANCKDGYIFETKELLLKRVCEQSTGVWQSGQGLPDCIYNSNASPRPPIHNNTHGCLTAKKECDIVGNGDFHACGGCHFFASCSEGYLSVRACPENLLYDAVSGVCDYHSRSCPNDNIVG